MWSYLPPGKLMIHENNRPTLFEPKLHILTWGGQGCFAGAAWVALYLRKKYVRFQNMCVFMMASARIQNRENEWTWYEGYFLVNFATLWICEKKSRVSRLSRILVVDTWSPANLGGSETNWAQLVALFHPNQVWKFRWDTSSETQWIDTSRRPVVQSRWQMLPSRRGITGKRLVG